MSEIPDQIRAIVADMLSIPEEQVAMNTSADTEPSWNSLQHLNIILEVEKSVGRQMPIEQLMECTSVEHLVKFWHAE